MGDSARPRMGSIVTSLATVPTELAHQIIDDLRVWDILRLLCYENERVDACIVSHPICRDMFDLDSDPAALKKTRFAAQFYRELLADLNKKFVPTEYWSERYLGMNIHCIAPKEYRDIMSMMRRRIHGELCKHWAATDLTQLGAYDYPELTEYTCPSVHRYSFQDMKERWQAIQKAKAILFKERSSELHWAANFLEENPDIIKRTLDPEQKRRSNTAHIVSRMRSNADKILRATRQRFVRSEHFRYEFFEIIPFDSALGELLDMMQKYGITSDDKVIVGDHVNSDGSTLQPSSISGLARVLVEGMAYFYPSPLMTPKKRDEMNASSLTNADGMVLRTGNTPWSAEPESVGVKDPYFTPHNSGGDDSFARPSICQWDPHGKKEQEWLEAFVKMYRYLKGLEV
ncbi:hypothetical protein N7475_005005 [Penicillium sp. IBT 31633x]|nr:hypothetical protein N7475_005005 [Penicillium sp. IBT 31633x]